MGDSLKIDVGGLIGGGSAVGEQATVLSTSHRQSMIGLGDAESGWVGSSADALVHMSDAWQQVADRHDIALTRQAEHVGDAARVFQSSDERNAAALRVSSAQ